jgi:hypothetical protein
MRVFHVRVKHRVRVMIDRGAGVRRESRAASVDLSDGRRRWRCLRHGTYTNMPLDVQRKKSIPFRERVVDPCQQGCAGLYGTPAATTVLNEVSCLVSGVFVCVCCVEFKSHL